MSMSAIIVMIFGMVVLWGGLAGSIINAIVKSRK